MKVVVVESPAKAKTIEKYLGPGHKVLASFGHVRDLPAKDGSVEPDKDFRMHYEMSGRGSESVRAIAGALKDADTLILATDPDREGEAISWHVLEALNNRKAIKGKTVKRVVFNEITKSAVLDAMAQPRDIDMDLVNAQQARRALDYLVGFTLSPVLWRKLPSAKSAGRVQSVALRLICERETEIEAFRPREYWTIGAEFLNSAGQKVVARLAELGGRKLDKFDIADEAAARAAVAKLQDLRYAVTDVQIKPAKRHPAPPFTTSTLQQEAARKLGFSAQMTMQIAQRLYEGVNIGGETTGLISYMRTDGVSMANEAIRAARDVIAEDFGREALPESWRVYKTKQKNAQEAHEAIRPTDFRRRPKAVARYLDDAQLKLYELIWTRALASQMESAELERTTIDIADPAGTGTFRATGTVVLSPGFLKLYEEGIDDKTGDEESDNRLPKLKVGDPLNKDRITPEQHFTEPPPRYSEASLVRKLEELGIGRPSTYAAILEVLKARNYVKLENKRFQPEDAGWLAYAFLVCFFEQYFAYGFTAALEEKLDEIAEHKLDWKQVLQDFWQDFSLGSSDLLSVKDAVARIDEKMGRRGEVLDAINALLENHFFPPREDGKPARLCPACNKGQLAIKAGRTGAFIGCSDYPDCSYTRPLSAGGGHGDIAISGPQEIGTDPATGQMVTLRQGPFGPYVQLGEPEGKEKPRRASLPRGVTVEDVTLELALKLLSLPRVVGLHPDTGKEIVAGLGRFGPYLLHDGAYTKLKDPMEAIEIGINHAVEKIAEADSRRKGPRQRAELKVLREVGKHPDDGEPINVIEGRYGPYLKHNGTNAPLPRGIELDDVTLEQAINAIAARAGSGKGKGRKVAKKAAAPKAARKKAEATDEQPKAKPKAKAKKKAAPKKKAAAKKAAAA
ncbi:MAG TPA: type I DNA topoisomerase [Ferrovibrio sp.]|jgi:DNA topoisomerase-1|uniref:type I DNA topoisomerase n=1 Tax=Ferrovibrio sp. TaxID=1917215 RepID=UPI002B4AEF4B|nr:type I DNA topoisomerase [Ferrovibrio sp.]HLT78911.1 type I DNA topoisomerase [Ferrovibrio sp.]